MFQSHLLTKGRSEPSLETKDGPEDVLPNIAVIIGVAGESVSCGGVEVGNVRTFICVTGTVEDVHLRATMDNFITSQLRNLFIDISRICNIIFNSLYFSLLVRLFNVM